MWTSIFQKQERQDSDEIFERQRMTWQDEQESVALEAVDPK